MKTGLSNNKLQQLKILLLIIVFFCAYINYSVAQTGTLIGDAEAESGILTGGLIVAKSISGYSGTGYVTNFRNSADKVSVSINVPEKAYYKIGVRYAAPNGKKNELVSVNSMGSTSVVFNASNGFTEADAGKYLFNAGANTITLQSEWGWIEIDKFLVFSVDNVKNSYAIVPNPVTINATSETKALYDFLRNNFNRKIISGQTSDWYDKVKPITGKSPLLRAYDFQHYTQGYAYKWVNGKHTFGAEDDGQVKAAIDWYNKTGKKGIVGFQWHWHSPSGGTAGKNTFYTSETTFDVTKAVISGTPENTLVLQDIDAIAFQLKRFQDAKVPVLWRPLHEASGGWFWWGAKGAAACVKLYDILYDRMTNFHKLDNLLWVWSSPEPEWYPGNDKTDMVGHDSYPGAFNYSNKKNDFDLLYKLCGGKKLIALTENGPIPKPDDCLNLDAPWSLFMTWSDFLTKENTNQHLIDVFSNPNVLTLESVTDAKKSFERKEPRSRVYPNPAHGKIYVSDRDYEFIEIINSSGNTVYASDEKISFIDVSALLEGFYMVRIIGNGMVFQEKILIVNEY